MECIATIKTPSWDTFIIDSASGDPTLGLEALEDKILADPLGARLVNVMRVATGREELDDDEVELACVQGEGFESPDEIDDFFDDSPEPSQEVQGACPRVRRLRGLRELLLVLGSQEHFERV